LSKHDSRRRDPAMWGCVQIMSVEGIDATARAPLIHSKCVPYNVSVMRVCWLVWNRLRRKQCFVSVSMQSQNLEPQLGPIWEQLRPKLRPILASKWRTYPAQSKILKVPVFIGIFHVFFALLSTTLCLKQCSPCCVSVGPNSVWSCRQSCQVTAC
jgi:hypothetical protein